ncbi:MAG: choice-of-anchor Q domain-containing protein [Candidatus Binataceae bacterium]
MRLRRPSCAATDERGVKRVAGSCDIGAYQS